MHKKNDEKNNSKKDKSCKQLLVFSSKLYENSAQKEYSRKGFL